MNPTDFSNLEDAVKYIKENQKKVEAYQKQQERMATYQKANPEKCREKALKYYANVKANEPDKYAKMKEQKRTRYNALKEVKEVEPFVAVVDPVIEPIMEPVAEPIVSQTSLVGANGMHQKHSSCKPVVVHVEPRRRTALFQNII
jgi:predicted ATP-grasp superfamily ATP-dependent carboligase